MAARKIQYNFIKIVLKYFFLNNQNRHFVSIDKNSYSIKLIPKGRILEY